MNEILGLPPERFAQFVVILVFLTIGVFALRFVLGVALTIVRVVVVLVIVLAVLFVAYRLFLA